MSLAFDRSYDTSFYGGTASSDSGAGTNYDIVLGGRAYMIDWEPADAAMRFGFHTLPLLQRYFLTQESGNIGEQTLNPEDYWRRSADDWHNGVGQLYNDRANSQREQYRASSGIDPWTIGEFSLLPDTTQLFTSVAATTRVVVAGGFLYMLDGNALSYATDLSSSFTAVTDDGPDTPLANTASIDSNGFMILVADGTRVHYTTRGEANFHKYHSADQIVSLVRMAKGRVFTAAANVLSTSSGTAGSASIATLLAHSNTDWTWVDVAPGPAAIYFAGYSGDKSLIYSTAVVSDGTNLNVPSVAAELPDGEIVRSLSSYLGVLLIGTTKGVRIAIMDSSGNLNVQGLINTPEQVAAFEPQGRFVWFGGGQPTEVDACDLYRMDLSTFNVNTPAYAPDLRHGTVAGNVSSVITFLDKRLYTKDGQGLFCESPTGALVPTGTLYQGWFNYALPDKKQAVKIALQFQAHGGTIALATAADFSDTYTQAGAVVVSSSDLGDTRILPTGNTEGIVHEVRVTLARDPLNDGTGPKITRFTLMSNPQPQRRIMITLPVLLHKDLATRVGNSVTINPALERSQIDAWCQSNQIISYQDAVSTYSVTVDDYDWVAYAQVGAQRTTDSLDGTAGLKLKVIS